VHKKSDQHKLNRKRYPPAHQQKLPPAPDVTPGLPPGTPGRQAPRLPSAAERNDKRQLALFSPEAVR
jgi:hypothetical protein